MASTDQSIAESGEGLRRLVGRLGTRGRVAASKGGPITRGGPRKNDKVEGTVRYNPIFDSPSSATSRKDNQRYRVRKGDEPIKDLVNFDQAREEVRRGRGKGPKKRYAEGGKVGSAMSALRQLAKEYKAAIMNDDAEMADRIRRRMELVKPGSSKGLSDSPDSAGREKPEPLAKGGVVMRKAKGGKTKGLVEAAHRVLEIPMSRASKRVRQEKDENFKNKVQMCGICRKVPARPGKILCQGCAE